MNIAIVDDRETDRIHLEHILKAYDSIHHIGMACSHFASGEAFLKAYQPFKYTVIFLDIYMDGISGIETAKSIRREDNDTRIVFLTTSEAFRPETFSLFATSYLVKPCAQEQVFSTLDHIFRLRTSEESRFSFSYDRQDFSLPYGDNVSLEMYGNYLSIADKTGRTYRTRMTFSAAMDQLDNRFFDAYEGRRRQYGSDRPDPGRLLPDEGWKGAAAACKAPGDAAGAMAELQVHEDP